MSRFTRSIGILKQTGHPLFVRMAETGRALPMTFGLGRILGREAEGHTAKRRIGGALHRLAFSQRYLEACAAAGAMRHDLDAFPVGPVSETHQAFARAELARRRGLNESSGAGDSAESSVCAQAAARPLDTPIGSGKIITAVWFDECAEVPVEVLEQHLWKGSV